MNFAPNDGALTRDKILGGRLTISQPARGHRAGTDAILLASLVPRDFAGRLVDVGAGVGTAGLVAAMRCPDLSAILLERDPLLAGLAVENIAANALGARVRVVAADLFARDWRNRVGSEAANIVITNPPFLDARKARLSRDALKRAAHVTERPLADWLRACVAMLRPGGSFALIHRADALADCVAAASGRLGQVTLRFVHPKAEESATRLLMTGVKGSRAPLQIVPPLVLHETDGRFMPLADLLHGGEGALG